MFLNLVIFRSKSGNRTRVPSLPWMCSTAELSRSVWNYFHWFFLLYFQVLYWRTFCHGMVLLGFL